MLQGLTKDVQFALRMLAANRGFSLVALATLGLGIGANTASFAIANSLLIRPLPYAHSERLVLLSLSNPTNGNGIGIFSYPRFQFLQHRIRTLESLAAFTNETFAMTKSGAEPEQVASARVSSGFFDTLGVVPLLGRTFRPEEDEPGGKQVTLISHGLWTRRFGRDPGIVGQSITLDTRSFTIVGVLPAGFQFGLLGSTVDVWTTRVYELNLATREQIQAGAGFLNAIGLKAPGASLQPVQAELRILDEQFRRESPKIPDADPKAFIQADQLQRHMVAAIRPGLLLVCGAVGLILLIACANVAGLLLSRALGRKREMAVRSAMGASRWLLMRQVLVESLILALAAGALGATVSLWATSALSALAQSNVPQMQEVRVDLTVMAFALSISTLTGILFGLLPALQISRGDLYAGLREEGRGNVGSRNRQRLRATLVVVQIAISVVLLIGSGLLIRSFIKLLNVSPGFVSSGVLTMNIALAPSKYRENAQIVAFFNEMTEQVRHLPGVQAAAVTSALPLNPSRFSPVLLEGQPQVPLAQRPVLLLQMVSPDYFLVMRNPLLRGRRFDLRDDAQAAQVAMVNRALAQRYWPNDNPVGKHIVLGRMQTPVEIVGVADEMKNISMSGEAMPEIYLPFAQRPWRNMNLIVRTSGDPHRLVTSIRARLSAIDADQPVTAVQTLDELLASSRAQPRVVMYLLGSFSLVALGLAILGLYGTISYSVAQRTQELGLRMALGAERADIVRMVLRQGVALALIGIVLGVVAGLVSSRMLASLLFQVDASDPLSFVASALAFACIAALASYVPALRATRIDPAMALRQG